MFVLLVQEVQMLTGSGGDGRCGRAEHTSASATILGPPPYIGLREAAGNHTSSLLVNKKYEAARPPLLRQHGRTLGYGCLRLRHPSAAARTHSTPSSTTAADAPPLLHLLLLYCTLEHTRSYMFK
jgi:hypothetical protein